MDAILAFLQAPAVGPVTPAEIVGDLTGVLCVWLVARQHLWSWPIGLLNNAFFLLIFWWAKLYADAALQLVFAALGVFGWWSWVRGTGEGDAELPVRRTTRREWLVMGAVVIFFTGAVARWLAARTDSPVPLWDASVLTLSLAATYGQARKLLESWWLWIAVDVLSVPLYVSRGLYPTAALYAVFLALCLAGLRAWTRALPREALA